MEIEAYTVTRAPPVHVYRRGPETHMEQKQYPQVFGAHHDHQYSTCSVAFSPCMQHATSTSIDIFMECPYHPQTIHTHVDKEANNKSDALTAPATPPSHCNTLFTHPQPFSPPPTLQPPPCCLSPKRAINPPKDCLFIKGKRNYHVPATDPRASNIPKTIKWTNAQEHFAIH